MSFELTTLGEYISIQGGYAYKSQQFIENSTYPVLKIKNIRTGYVDINDCAYIDKNSADETERYIVSEGDVLISLTGSGPNAPQSLVGRVARFWDKGKRAWVNQRVGRVVLKKDKTVHKDFIFYFLGTKESQNYLVANSSGSANQANINGAIIEALPFPRIDYSTSKKISKVLRTLDEKINLNNQINQTLESIAQAIFKSWFIDFEPVRAKIAAKQTGQDPERAAMCAISGKTQAELEQMAKEDFAELQATAALFPDELVESELGEVPRGWELQQLKDIAKYSSNKILLNDLNLENYISTENMLSEKKGIEKASSLPKANSVPAFRKGNILVSNIRPYFKKIWLSSFDGGHSNDVLNFEILEKETEEYLYNLIYQDSFFDQMMASSKGSKMPRGDKKAIMDFQTVTSSVTLRKLYSKKVRKFYSQQNSIEIENQILINLRDALLPKLLSGELDVSGLQGEGA